MNTIPELLRKLAAELRREGQRSEEVKRQKCAHVLHAAISLARLNSIFKGASR